MAKRPASDKLPSRSASKVRSTDPVTTEMNMRAAHETLRESSDARCEATRTTSRALPTLDMIGEKAKALQSAIKDIERFGIQAADIELPKIVVIGDQSAGKSSLVEAISEIKTPRGAGTCTRCPLQIILTDGGEESWQCEISLLNKYVYDPSRQISSEEEPPPLDPWFERATPDIINFKSIASRDLDKLEREIKLAQTAILNPSTPESVYANWHESDPPNGLEVQFSPNVVSINITAPGLPCLSFYDLPGVINQAPDFRDVVLIENLVRMHVREQNTLVLLCIAMESDIENSRSSSILRSARAEGRCLGVLTKPDRLDGAEKLDHWKSVLNHQAYPLGLGYFVTKQPGPRELERGITHAQARLAEENWFMSEDWMSKFPGNEARLGTRRLQKELSVQLATLVQKNLPDLEAKVANKFNEIDAQLRSFPEPVQNPEFTVLQLIDNLTYEFSQHIGLRANTPGSCFFLSSWKQYKAQFKNETLRKRPVVTFNAHKLPANPYASVVKKQNRPATTTDAICIADDCHDSPRPDSAFEVTPSPAKAQRLTNTAEVKPVSLPSLYTTIESRNGSLPGMTDTRTIEDIATQTLKGWDAPFHSLMNVVKAILQHAYGEVSGKILANYKTVDLAKKLEATAETFIRLHVGDVSSKLEDVLGMEKRGVMTENSATLDRMKTEFWEEFKLERYKRRAIEYLGRTTYDNIEELDENGLLKQIFERNTKKPLTKIQEAIGKDPFTREVEAAATIRAYYEIAAARWIDNVCQRIELDLFYKLRLGLKENMVDKVGLFSENGKENCARLLEDNKERAQLRETLKKKREGLRKALERLEALDQEFSGPEPRIEGMDVDVE